MNRLVVLCAVFLGGLAVGGAASWLILDQGDRTPPRSAAGPAASAEPAVRESSQVPLRAESRAPTPGIHPKAFRESSQDVAAELGIVTTGAGTISGKVKTEKGEPVAGAIVRADFNGDRGDRAREWKKGDGPPPELDMQTQVQRYIEDTERARAMRKETTTGENGEFTLTGLLDDRYSVQAYLKGCVINSDQQQLAWNAHPGAWIDFTASRVTVVTVDVRLADGTTPKRAQINVARNNNNNVEPWRPEAPELRLGAGSYAISATSGDHDEWRAEAQNVTLKEGAAPAPLVFRLTARTGIRGRVHVPKGYAVDSLSIFALRYAGTAVPDEGALRRGQNNWASQWNGYEFNFYDLAPGTWLLGAGTWESVFATRTVEVAAGVLTDVILEITDAGAAGLVVKVVAPDGSPVADATVRVYSATSSYDSPEVFTVRPKKDGAWVVVAKKDQTADTKDWFVQVRSERYGEKTVPMPAPGAGELAIQLVEPATLEVTVTGYAGSALEGRLRIDVHPFVAGKDKQSRVFYGRDDQIGPDGRQTFKALQPGKYRVELQYQQERWNTSKLDYVDIDVAAGANTVAMPVPVVYTLTVIVAGEAADAQLNLQQVGTAGAEERWHRAKVGADGTATVEGLTAGTYKLSLWGSKSRRQRSMNVTVPAPGPVTFKEDVETSLLIRSLDAEGYLASAGLQAGDKITGCDGSAFDGSRPASQVLSGLMTARKDVKIQWVRDGKQLEATVDSEKFAVATNHLRSLEPGTR